MRPVAARWRSSHSGTWCGQFYTTEKSCSYRYTFFHLGWRKVEGFKKRHSCRHALWFCPAACDVYALRGKTATPLELFYRVVM